LTNGAAARNVVPIKISRWPAIGEPDLKALAFAPGLVPYDPDRRRHRHSTSAANQAWRKSRDEFAAQHAGRAESVKHDASRAIKSGFCRGR
jgi:hypothetical protein